MKKHLLCFLEIISIILLSGHLMTWDDLHYRGGRIVQLHLHKGGGISSLLNIYKNV